MVETLSMQVIRSPKVYDAVIIGSGAGGGMAAMVLTQKGLDCALLEGGPPLDPTKDYKEHIWPYDLTYRGRGAGYRHNLPVNDEFNEHLGGWNLKGEPFTVAPGQRFMWFRSRIMGGRTNIWGRISLRFSPYDFKPYSTDGAGADWPISYEDVAPYYDRTERFIGVMGDHAGMESAPDGIYMPPPPPRCYERIVAQGARKLGIPTIALRNAIITRDHDGRAACHYCNQCGRGCMTASRFSSVQVCIPKALATGRLKIHTNAFAREITTDENGRATGVSYIDRTNRVEHHVRAKAVLVAGGCLESTRLLMNSKSSRHPNGLANSSGELGKHLTDTVGFSMGGYFPKLMGRKIENEDGIGGGHLMVPWWLQGKGKRNFRRGYHIEMGGGAQLGGVMGSGRLAAQMHDGYGSELKKHAKEIFGTTFGFAGRGEMIPNDKSFAEIDPEAVDAYGVPVLRIHWQWGEEEVAMAKHMEQTFEEMVEAAGGVVTRRQSGISIGGEIIHEIGTARMGNDPRSSVLNKFNQAHEVRNLFVVDGAAFPSNPEKNPTLSILALSWRASDYLAEEAKKGNI